MTAEQKGKLFSNGLHLKKLASGDNVSPPPQKGSPEIASVAGKNKIVLSYMGLVLFLLMFDFSYKIPMSTDDWHWGVRLKAGEPIPLLDGYFYRLPICRLIFRSLIPILIYHPFWGKLVAWGAGIVGFIYILAWFFKKYGVNPIFLPLASCLVFFAPGQFEIVFNRSSLPFSFGFLFVGLGFYFQRRRIKTLGTLFYLLSFFTLEAFISLVILLEFAVQFEGLQQFNSLKRVLRMLAPAGLLYFALRLSLHLISPYPYSAVYAFDWGQVRGLIIQCFLIDFYKLNTILSSIQLLLYGFLIGLVVKNRSVKTPSTGVVSSLVLIFVFVATSAYYFVLSYSARRGLAGQIAFVWGAYCVAILVMLFRLKARRIWRLFVFLPFISMQIANHVLIYQTKRDNFWQAEREVALVKERLKAEASPVEVDMKGVRSRFKRDWVFASDEDVKKMLEFRLRKEDYARLVFE